MSPRHDPAPFTSDPLWYKDAIIYELHVRAFADSNGDGIGDFRGLAGKLDYLQDLGVTAIWLLPFFPSPLKDDGYDIADYTAVYPPYGTIADFKRFLKEAHRRGLRVITELVLNHTSDQHPWFQRARRAQPGSKYRDFYVWSDTPDRYREARIIFQDFETSNWSWDPLAKAYYWHRFYSHQPDLNYDNPEVRKAAKKFLDFWLRMGVDGIRLDAVPYLYEREETNGENLPETHAFLKELRRHIDEHYQDRMILAEANQWPEDAIAYFGDGDECHMNFHFPLMPRLFMAIYMENRYPIIDILRQTPPIPENCQWALFLRNHDELTLEMVTDEDRDYMYRVYAQDPRARINLGIRRRLAPLLGNNRRRIELMNGLLFSLPGTPVIYYGDEIGMGDNIYLGDRDGVRTPMQWSADRNAGFSRANPQRLYLPIIIDPEYHYEAVNVDAQQGNPSSLLWWMKRLVAMRKRLKAFGRGTMEVLHPENRRVLAFLRRYGDERILVVANLSRFVQAVELDLSAFAGMVPVEMFGHTPFPPIGELPYFVTLGPHSFYWFTLEPEKVRVEITAREAEALPQIAGLPSWEKIFEGEYRTRLENTLPSYLKSQRWFGGKARVVLAVRVAEVIPVLFGRSQLFVTLVQVNYTEGEPQTYVLTLAYAPPERAGQIRREIPQAAVANLKLRGESEAGTLYDALLDRSLSPLLLDIIARQRTYRGLHGELKASTTHSFRRLLRSTEGSLEPSPMRAEQSNTSVLYGDRLILKLFRRPEEGLNPDLEIGRFLTERRAFEHVPPVAGALEYRRGSAEPMTLAILQGYVPNEGDAWEYTLDNLKGYFERVLTQESTVGQPTIPSGHLLEAAGEDLPETAGHVIGPYLEAARLLGQRTAELHVALASDKDDPNFAPESFTSYYQRSLYQTMRMLASEVFQLLMKRLATLPEDIQGKAREVLQRQEEVLDLYGSITRQRIHALRIRCHGDYHLGQVLYTGKDFVIIDFEGEPARTLNERRRKRSPLQDVAGMLRSFHYAAYTALFHEVENARISAEVEPAMERWARFWFYWVSATFLRSYLEVASHDSFLPKDPVEIKTLLDAYLLDKAVYELGYELNNRPDWVRIPVEGITQLLDSRG